MPGFIFIALALLAVTVYTVFLLLVAFFAAKKRGKLFILILLIGVSLGFLVVMPLIRLFNNIFLNLLYIFLSLGIGLLFYLTISAIAFQILKLVKINIPQSVLAKIGVIVAFILFFIGIFNANNSQIRNITVKMTNLSSNWQGKRIVQISDSHLGIIYGPEFLKKQIVKINALKPDLIVITGDLFDGENVDLSKFTQELKKLEAKEGVIFVPGNHDTYLGLDKIEPVLNAANIKILRDEAINIKGLEIIGFDFTEFAKDDTSRVVKNLDINSTTARLLLNHVPKDISLAKELGVSLQLSGHSHRGQMFPLSLMTRVIFGKYQYGLHTEGAYNIYTSSGLGSWGPPVRTFNPAEIVSIIIN